MTSRLPIGKIQKRYAALVELARRIAGEKHSEAPGIFEGERAKQYGFHDAENSGIRSDTYRQREDHE